MNMRWHLRGVAIAFVGALFVLSATVAKFAGADDAKVALVVIGLAIAFVGWLVSEIGGRQPADRR